MRTTLRQDEKMLLTVREHWLILLMPLIILIITAAIAVTASHYYPKYWWIAAIIALLFIFNFIWKLLQRKTNIWVVTNLRVIDEYGVLSIHSIESPLDKINNVEYDQSLWGRLFGYGDVKLQTAAEMGETVYRFLANPKRLQTVIFNAQGDFNNSIMRQKSQSLADAIHEESTSRTAPTFETAMEQLYKLKTQGIITDEEYSLRKQKLMEN